MKAVRIPADNAEAVSLLDVADSAQLRKQVGGWLEGLTLETGVMLMFNEEGKLQGLPFNQRATDLVAGRLRSDDFISGNAVVIGFDSEGDTVDLPQSWIDRLIQPNE